MALNRYAINVSVPDATWSSHMPDNVGLYLMRCGENDGKPEAVAITRRSGLLTVHSEDFGRTILTHFHDGLTNTEWLRVA